MCAGSDTLDEVPSIDHPLQLDGDYNDTAVSALAAKQCTEDDKQTNFKLEKREQCPHLTQTRRITMFKGSKLLLEHAKVQTYLGRLFAGFTDTSLSHIEEDLLDLGKTAPPIVSLAATDLVISLRSRHQQFFSLVRTQNRFETRECTQQSNSCEPPHSDISRLHARTNVLFMLTCTIIIPTTLSIKGER